MADLTYDTSLQFSGLIRKSMPYVITNGLQIYTGQILKLTSGLAALQAAGAGTIVAGIAVAPGVPGGNPVLDGFNLQSLPIPQIAPGNVSTARAGNANAVVIEQGEFTLKRQQLAVAGTLAGTNADVGKVLYAPDSNVADLSTTQTSTDKPFGEISAFYAGTSSGGFAYYDVLVYSYEARRAM